MTVAPAILAALLAAQGTDVVARVDGAAITRDALAHRVAGLQSPGRTSPEQVLDTVIGETLLAAEGRRMGLAGSPEVVSAIEVDTRRAAVESMFAKMTAEAKPDEARIRALFHSTADYVSFDSAVFETRENAAAALRRAQQGASFADATRGAVVATIAPKPDQAQPTMRGQIPSSLAEALFAAPPGALVGPVEANNGWTVARVIRKETGTDEQFAAKRESLLKYAREQLSASSRNHLANQLKAGAKISIDEPFLRSVDAARATREQLDHVVATANGAPVRYRDIYPAIRSLSAGSGHMGGAAVKIMIAEKEATERLLQAAAADRGFTKDPAVQAKVPYIERMALARVAVERIQASAPPPTEDEISAQYREHASAYGKRFEEVLPSVAADAAEMKRARVLEARVQELRKKASISIDREALKASRLPTGAGR